MRLNDKIKATELRRQGKSYNEIRNIIPILSKGTLCGWLKNIKLTTEQKRRIENKMKQGRNKGRIKGAWSNRQKRIQSILTAKAEAKQTLPQFIQNPLFITGLVLYWAEGGKTQERFQFMNSDPRAIQIMTNWLMSICYVPKEKIKFRLYIHKIYAHEQCENFWSKIIGVPVYNFKKTVYKPTPHKIKKNPNYKGCMRIDCGGVELFRKIMGWEETFIEYLKDNKLSW